MTPTELLALFRALGLSQLEAARRLMIVPSTLTRQLQRSEIPGPVAAAVRAWRKIQELEAQRDALANAVREAFKRSCERADHPNGWTEADAKLHETLKQALKKAGIGLL